jgi:hypothetical protein
VHQIRRIDVLSCAKILATILAGNGLIIGALASIGQAGRMGLFGVAAIVVLPIVYGLAGFLTGAVSAVLYNFAAGIVGGLEVEIDSQPPS